MKLLKIILTIIFLSPPLAYALSREAATDVFSKELVRSLRELKYSVDQLSRSNEYLAFKNSQFKTSVNDLQATLKKLMEENQQMTEASLKLQGVTPAKTKKIAQLQKEGADLDNKINSLTEQIKVAEDNMVKAKNNDQILSNQESSQPDLSRSDNASLALAEAAEQKQKQKIAILKMISDSQHRQDFLNDQILDFQKNTPGIDSLQEQSSRKNKWMAQVERLQQDIAQLNSTSNSSQARNEELLHQLEVSITRLENNRDILQGLLVKMKQKAQLFPMSQSQKNEEAKLQSQIDQLKKVWKNLKFDLEELQQKMVELDKRKYYLESLLKK